MKKNFKTDLDFGQAAEAAFLVKFPKLVRTDGRAGDFLMPSGGLLELKVERRPSTQTGNIFFEHYSHRDRKTPGGPFKAKEDGASLFSHWFMSDDRLFIFDTEKIIKFLVDNHNELRYHYVRGSNSTGYIVPISQVVHLELNLEDILNDTAKLTELSTD